MLNRQNHLKPWRFPFHSYKTTIFSTKITNEKKEELENLDLPKEQKTMLIDFACHDGSDIMLVALAESLEAEKTPEGLLKLARTCLSQGEQMVLTHPLIALEFFKEALTRVTDYEKAKTLIFMSLAHERLFKFYHSKRKRVLSKWNEDLSTDYFNKAISLLDDLTTNDHSLTPTLNRQIYNVLTAAACYVKAELMYTNGELDNATQQYYYTLKSLELANAMHFNYYYPKLKMRFAALLMQQTTPEHNPLETLRDIEKNAYFIKHEDKQYTDQIDLFETLGDCLAKAQLHQESLEKYLASLNLLKDHLAENTARMARLEEKIENLSQIAAETHSTFSTDHEPGCYTAIIGFFKSTFKKRTYVNTLDGELTSYKSNKQQEPLIKKNPGLKSFY